MMSGGLVGRHATLKAQVDPDTYATRALGESHLKVLGTEKFWIFLKSGGLGSRHAALKAQVGPDTYVTRALRESHIKTFGSANF